MFSESLKAEITGLFRHYPEKRAALIMALHAVQREKGRLSPVDFVELGGMFGEHPAEIQSVASFYDMFHVERYGRCVIEVCTNASCMLGGSVEMADHLRGKLGIEFGETTSDGIFTLREAECLAACDMAPLIVVNGEFIGPVTIESLDELIEERRRSNIR
jgi:NADH:ubiquinone oxidoreductase subunit E